MGADAKVASCYEAGRDGFSIHRFLSSAGIENVVIDPASVEVPRRKRRSKTDRLDAAKLLTCLMRHRYLGDRQVWRLARVPGEEEEAQRRVHRERERLVRESTSHRCRIRSLLTLHGACVFDSRLSSLDVSLLRDWAGKALPENVRAELERETARLGMVEEQIAEIERRMRADVKEPRDDGDRKAAKLAQLKAIAETGARTLVREFFGWREFRNRREVGSLAGLTGTPYSSGESQTEQGISKAGNRRVRTLMIELAWLWLRYQPKSALSIWYESRFGGGNKRQRRIGIVALARKLLIALWKYLEYDLLPEGAELKSAGPTAKRG